MKNPKKKRKAPFTRRQFVGSCAAGASMIGFAPYLSLTGCESPREECEIVELPNKLGISGTRPVIDVNYDGKIGIDITFPGYVICKKKMKFGKATKIFNYVYIESLGWMAYSGRPELPYLGLLVHIPSFLHYELTKVESPSEWTRSIPVPGNIYPSQIKLMDNKDFNDNHGNPEFDEGFYINPPDYYPYEVVGEPDIVHFGYSRFLLVKIYPYVWLPNENEAKFHTNVQIDIKVVPKDKNEMEDSYYYETPFINKTFKLANDLRIDNPVPNYERIIDPWSKDEKVTQILGEVPVFKETYVKNGPEQLIIYDDDAQLVNPATALFEFKINKGINVGIKKKSSLEEDVFSYLRKIRQPRISGNQILYPSISDVILFGDFRKKEKPTSRENLNNNVDEAVNNFAELRNRDIYFNLPAPIGSASEIERNADLKKEFYTDFYGGTPRLPFSQEEILIPDINVGRIPARSEEEGNLIVDNIKGYENEKKYKVRENLILAGYFQDSGKERMKPDGVASTDYIQTLEAIRSGVGTNINVSTYYQIQESRAHFSKLRYRNKIEVGQDVGFKNDENCINGLLESFHSGGNIMVHRDHGWMDGWSRPTFKIPDFWKLSNPKFKIPKEKYSIVFNINCLSGHYMGEETCLQPNLPNQANDCFSEALLKGTIPPDQERINLKCPAVIASVMESPTFHNDWFVKGMFEKIYGNILSEIPNTNDHEQKLGDILKFGRLLLFAYIENNSLSIYTSEIYHILGDPSIKV